MKSKIITALLSVFVAFGLWLYVITVVSPGSEKTFYNISADIQGEGELEARGLMITGVENTKVNLRLEGNRSDLDILNSSNITVNVDVSNIYEPGEHDLPYTVNFPGQVPNNAISILKRTPDTVRVTVEEWSSKSINLEDKGEFDISNLPEDYLPDTDNMELDEEFKITGPKRIIDQIDDVKFVVPLKKDMKEFNDYCPYILLDKEGNEIPEEARELLSDDLEKEGYVHVKLQILRLKEVKLEVTVIAGGGATAENTQIKIETPTIQVAGSEKLLKDLEVINIGKVDLGQILTDQVLEFELVLPEGIVNKSDETVETTIVKVDIRFPEHLRTKTINITEIAAANVPAGMKADIITQALTLTLRGPKAQLDAIEEKDVKVTVDFSDAQAGTATMKLTVTLAKGFEEVGVVAPPTVTAKLQKES